MSNKRNSIVMNSERAKGLFVTSVVLVLAVTAGAKFISTFGSDRILTIQEPILGISYRNLLLLGAIIEGAVAIYLVCGKAKLSKYLFIAWLGTIFSAYRIALWWEAPGKMCPCLGTITGRLPVSASTADLVMKATLAYMIIGSVLLLLSEIKMRRANTSADSAPESTPVV